MPRGFFSRAAADAAAGGSSAGAPHPFRRMSPGVGLRPTPPPLLRLQGHGAPALDPPALPRDARFSLPAGRGGAPHARDDLFEDPAPSFQATRTREALAAADAAAGGSSAGAPYPFRRMSPGVGLRPTPPPLLRLQGHGAPALDPPALPRDARFSLPTASRAPSRPVGPWQSKGGGGGRRPPPGDICTGACRPRRGPPRSR